MNNRSPITINSKFFEEISKKIQNTEQGFSSVEDYVDYVLEEILFGKDAQDNEHQKQMIESELKKLGYL
ncbi:CopG family transcriptional regulator [Candidatus Nitrosotenuis cloacae]|uniref:CopG family transcriptional regulator n=1 Tax=Candidatus Nitrosotenuis cloacae TaxID=1603555 RepID=UPI00228180D7|nr:CopG family transcriptional regulator [Candidatus Nitrosotenuis cloacae]